ncbi:MAG: hypothetical protein RM022_004225 [Nostoc sp. EfeVER01]|uniref:hypothetical protein n=1 Tax=Nostoc sp. EfeVER01 TaxID=3075406 RepID=UPI002AD2949C|nr:hypothetical protein [Nostoc sp. EfeVER01]MDZ7944369.1 hypothetical protein [Nostoc sp. EfeVER01]
MSNEWIKNGYLLITYYLLLITPESPHPSGRGGFQSPACTSLVHLLAIFISS